MEQSSLDKPTDGIEDQLPARKSLKDRGCLFWGCLTAIILSVLAVAAVGLVTYSTAKYLRKFTSDAPADLPTYTSQPGDAERITQQIEIFRKAVDEGTSGVTLVLTADDINAVIASDENLKEIRDKVHIKIEGDKMTAEACIPLEGVPMFSGLYLNGTITMKASMDDGILMVTMDSMTVNGEPIPEQFMAALRKENFAKEMYKDTEKAELLRRVKDVRVQDGKLILESK